VSEARAGELPGRLLIIGAGLIGTSLGLATSRRGVAVTIVDTDLARAEAAAGLGAAAEALATVPQARASYDVVVVATPPVAIAPVVIGALRSEVAPIVTHVGSVQTQPRRDVEASGVASARFVGGHPIAGRELSGPEAADADLFRDRPWVLCPTPDTDRQALAVVAGLATAVGAVPTELAAEAHDELFARLSHVPQLVASALAASLVEVGALGVGLAGSGMRDTTRLADSDPELWAQIVVANAGAVADALDAVTGPLGTLAQQLRGDDAATAVADLVRQGRAGRSLLPGKHGGAPAAVATLQVVVPDEPGALARLLDAVAAEGVNLEDLRVDHAPGRPLGLADLVVAPGSRESLADALRTGGWSVHAAGGAAL
jgi:prephenate dehydrogenase